MWNVMKMDLYRMFRSKAMYVILAINVIFIAMVVYVLKYDPDDVVNAVQVPGTVDAFQQIASSGIFCMFMSIFAVIFVCSEHVSGFIKNTASQVRSRSELVLSKVILMAIFTAVQYLVCVPALFLAIRLVFGSIVWTSMSTFVLYMGMTMLLQVAISALVIMVSTITRNTAISMTFAICLCSNLFAIIIGLLNRLIPGVEFEKYSLITNLSVLPTSYDSSIYMRVLIVSVVCALAYSVIGCFAINKQDVR